MSLPFGLSPGIALALAVVLFAAAFVRGYSGFGFSAIIVAFAALVTNPLPIIPAAFLCEIAMTAVQARGIRGSIDWRRVAALLSGTALALPLSILTLARAPVPVARLTVSALILVLALVLLSGWQLRRRLGWRGHAATGVAAGLANAAGVGGLPVAALLAAQPVPPAVFRATLVAFLTGLDLLSLPWMAAAGLIGRDTVVATLMALPILTCGILLGGRRFLSASPRQFRRMAVVLLLGLALLGLLRAALG